jgi:hypothetical protein
MMRIFCFLFLFFPFIPAGAGLPDQLELEYSLNYGELSIGKVTKKLLRQKDGLYYHTSWSRPSGVAKVLTQAEWLEEGWFNVIGQDVRPRTFSETRRGDKKAYYRKVIFDWPKARLVFNNGQPSSLPPGSQDQGSFLYLFMLRSFANLSEQSMPITDGKTLKFYKFIYAGKEILETPFGKLETTVLQRLPSDPGSEPSCRNINVQDPANLQKCVDPADDFTVWLLPDKYNIPAKIRKRKNNDNFTLVLKSAGGF